MRTVMITGAFGFIGSNLVKMWVEKYPFDKLILVDGMTYAARPEWLRGFLKDKDARFKITEHIINITDQAAVARVMKETSPDLVLHLAAESHVCRSITGPKDFVMSNVVGTFNLLEEFYQLQDGAPDKWFIHVSTDEVFGELSEADPAFTEKTNIAPRSPYSATKAGSDHLAFAYFHTYGVPVIVTNCSNNFGANQHEEKLIPATINRILSGQPAKLHGDGLNVRDWLAVADHCEALMLLAEKGKPGERYCIGGEDESTNLEVVNAVHAAIIQVTGQAHDLELQFTNDRPTDDKRYAIDCTKLKALGWNPSKEFWKNLLSTVRHYLAQSKREGGGHENGSLASVAHA